MILIHYAGLKIPANNDGTLISPPTYWGQEIFDGIAAAFANGDYVTIPEPEPSEPEPDWEGFLTLFYNPPLSGSSFDIIESRVQTAWINAAASQSEEAMREAMTLRTHWQNCLMGLTNPTIRSREWLSSSWSFLQLLMSQCAVAIPADELKYIQELFQQYNLL